MNPCHDRVVEIDHVTFGYEQRNVLDNVNFTIYERDFVGLIGSNGAGKTTLLKMLVGLLKPTKGEVRMFGQPLPKFKDWQRIGYVPQKTMLNPLFPATVREVVMSGLYNRRSIFKRLGKTAIQKCEDAMYAMGVEDLAKRRIGQLSGGQQQRVLLARALVNHPSLMILDEPTVGIDTETQEKFFHMIRHMHQHHHMTFLMVSHDVEALKAYLGHEPKHTSGKLKFYVKHTHELHQCEETNVSHSLRDAARALETVMV